MAILPKPPISKGSMIVVTSVEAQSRFGELIDRAQREPIEITRRGGPVAYVVSEHDIRELGNVRRRREEAVPLEPGRSP
jgi:antitoxin Phd